MRRELVRIGGEALGRPVHVWCYGHFGPPLIVFPSASGMAHEWESHGMVEALGDLLEQGELKLYCTESNVSETWTRRDAPVPQRLARRQAFEKYVLTELVPFVRRDCQDGAVRIATAGCSLGALDAADVLLKRPDLFCWALCMSGRYDTRGFIGDADSEAAYHANPIAYVPNLHGAQLERLRRDTHFVLVCGQGQWEEGNIDETRRLAEVLSAKGIPHELDLWGADVSHEWPWWRKQARHHIGRALGRS